MKERFLWKTGKTEGLDQKITFFTHPCHGFHVQTNVTFSRHFFLLWLMSRALLVKILPISSTVVYSCFIQFPLVSCRAWRNAETMVTCQLSPYSDVSTSDRRKKKLLPFCVTDVHSIRWLLDGIKPGDWCKQVNRVIKYTAHHPKYFLFLPYFPYHLSVL